MKVGELVKMLKKEDQNADVIIYVATDGGYSMVRVGLGDATIGRIDDDDGAVEAIVIPADATGGVQPWEGEDQDAQTSRNKNAL